MLKQFVIMYIQEIKALKKELKLAREQVVELEKERDDALQALKKERGT